MDMVGPEFVEFVMRIRSTAALCRWRRAVTEMCAVRADASMSPPPAQTLRIRHRARYQFVQSRDQSSRCR